MPSWLLKKDEMAALIVAKNAQAENLKVYERAYWQWYRGYWSKEFDDDLEKLMKLEIPMRSGWLKFARNAQLASTRTIAKCLNITESTYIGLENSEREMRINLKRLAEVAATLNCELVYFLKPKKGARLSEHVWRQLYDVFKNDKLVQDASIQRRHKVLASVIKRGFAKAKFRQQMGWSTKKEELPRKDASQFFF